MFHPQSPALSLESTMRCGHCRLGAVVWWAVDASGDGERSDSMHEPRPMAPPDWSIPAMLPCRVAADVVQHAVEFEVFVGGF